MTNDFKSLGLPAKLLQSLARMQYTTPTPIQAQAIPHALQGRDVLGSAQTGTGKTAAFGIPLVAALMAEPEMEALIMTPTRELAAQVLDTLEQLIPTPNIKTALLIGGEPMPKQLRQLQQRPRLIVGTPGRINDHLERRSVRLDRVGFLVLDETDRMLDMGFGVQIDRILKHVPDQRQTLMFSATMPPEIVRMAGKYLDRPERVAVGSTIAPVVKIRQENIKTSESEKYNSLLAELLERKGSILVFVKTKYGADRLAEKLRKADHAAEAIHGNLKQSKRDRVLQGFRDGKNRILVATDVVARGLDIPHIRHVINYDPPQCPEDYIHRIGRTARAGADGSAVNLVTPSDGAKWHAVHKLMNPGEASVKPLRTEGKKPPRRKFGKSSAGKGGYVGPRGKKRA